MTSGKNIPEVLHEDVHWAVCGEEVVSYEILHQQRGFQNAPLICLKCWRRIGQKRKIGSYHNGNGLLYSANGEPSELLLLLYPQVSLLLCYFLATCIWIKVGIQLTRWTWSIWQNVLDWVLCENRMVKITNVLVSTVCKELTISCFFRIHTCNTIPTLY